MLTRDCYLSSQRQQIEYLGAQSFAKLPLATARTDSCNGPVHLFVCLFVCLSVCLSVSLFVTKMQKKRFSQKAKQFTAVVSINDLQEVVYRLLNEPINHVKQIC